MIRSQTGKKSKNRDHSSPWYACGRRQSNRMTHVSAQQLSGLRIERQRLREVVGKVAEAESKMRKRKVHGAVTRPAARRDVTSLSANQHVSLLDLSGSFSYGNPTVW